MMRINLITGKDLPEEEGRLEGADDDGMGFDEDGNLVEDYGHSVVQQSSPGAKEALEEASLGFEGLLDVVLLHSRGGLQAVFDEAALKRSYFEESEEGGD